MNNVFYYDLYVNDQYIGVLWGDSLVIVTTADGSKVFSLKLRNETIFSALTNKCRLEPITRPTMRIK